MWEYFFFFKKLFFKKGPKPVHNPNPKDLARKTEPQKPLSLKNLPSTRLAIIVKLPPPPECPKYIPKPEFQRDRERGGRHALLALSLSYPSETLKISHSLHMPIPSLWCDDRMPATGSIQIPPTSKKWILLSNFTAEPSQPDLPNSNTPNPN